MIALRGVSTNKMRSVLTTLGIIIGIVSVTGMATVVNGIEKGFEEDMASLGADVIYIEKWPWARDPGMKWWNYINRPRITADLAEVLEERSRFVDAATAVAGTGGGASYKENSVEGVQITGATSTYPRVHLVEISDGTYFTDLDEQSNRDVVVIGSNVAENLFPFEDPIGKQIRLRGRKFRVIGVFVKQGEGSDGGSSADNTAHVPFKTFSKHWGTRWRDVSVQAKLDEGVTLEDAKDEMRGVLRVARRLDAKEDDDFELNEQASLRAQIEPIKNTIYAIGIGLTALALLVGGIGVMNIMFVTVKERTREIGIRKAVGARRRTILLQFLIEAVVICMVGGLVGVGLSVPLAMLIQLALPASLDFGTVVMAFSICVAIGTVFGLAPAWTAAKAPPIEALRYE